jgi:hypothetical protein
MSWKDCHVECGTLFHSHVDMFMHQYILNNIKILGKIKQYVIHHELQHHGSICAHIILWVHEYDLEIITDEIVTFLLTMFDEIITKFTPPNDSLQLKLFKMVLQKQLHEHQN